MVMRDKRLEVPYESPEDAQAREDRELGIPFYYFGAQRRAFREALKAKKSGNTGRMSPIVEREMPGREMDKFLKSAPRQDLPKNVDAGRGRGTITPEKGTGAYIPKMAPKRPEKPRVASKPAMAMEDINQSQMTRPGDTMQYDNGTLNPSEFAPGRMGPSGISAQQSSESTTAFGPTPEQASEMVSQAPRMRRGLFGEEISQEDYDAMTQRNKDAGFYSRFKKGGQVKKKPVKKMAKGGSVSSASKRADGCATRGKTKGRMV